MRAKSIRVLGVALTLAAALLPRAAHAQGVRRNGSANGTLSGGTTSAIPYWTASTALGSAGLTWNNGTSTLVITSGLLTSGVSDGATAKAFVLDTSNALSNGAAKLLSIRNATTEEAYFAKNGALTFSGVANGSSAITLGTGNKITFGDSTTQLTSCGPGTTGTTFIRETAPPTRSTNSSTYASILSGTHTQVVNSQVITIWASGSFYSSTGPAHTLWKVTYDGVDSDVFSFVFNNNNVAGFYSFVFQITAPASTGSKAVALKWSVTSGTINQDSASFNSMVVF